MKFKVDIPHEITLKDKDILNIIERRFREFQDQDYMVDSDGAFFTYEEVSRHRSEWRHIPITDENVTIYNRVRKTKECLKLLQDLLNDA